MNRANLAAIVLPALLGVAAPGVVGHDTIYWASGFIEIPFTAIVVPNCLSSNPIVEGAAPHPAGVPLFIPNGACYPAGHIAPSDNGDVTFTVVDALEAIVGGCISQDSDGDGVVCSDGEFGDVQARFCNEVTVNINFDDANGVPLEGAWDFGARPTWVLVNNFHDGWGPLGPVNPDCGENVNSFGTVGTIIHS